MATTAERDGTRGVAPARKAPEQAASRYRMAAPSPALADAVAAFWYQEGRDEGHAKERVLPTGTLEVVINLRDDGLRVYDRDDPERHRAFGDSLIVGPHSAFTIIDTASQASLLGIHFRPGGAFPFLDLPADALHNDHAPLEALWGRGAEELRARLLAAPDDRGRFGVLEGALLARRATAPPRHPAVAFALAAFARVPQVGTIAATIAATGLPTKRFIALFSQEVGLTPKRYCRIRRFQDVLRRIERAEEVDWTAVAVACGYYDQSHCIRDFRDFAGINPTAYLARRTPHRNHVPLLA